MACTNNDLFLCVCQSLHQTLHVLTCKSFGCICRTHWGCFACHLFLSWYMRPCSNVRLNLKLRIVWMRERERVWGVKGKLWSNGGQFPIYCGAFFIKSTWIGCRCSKSSNAIMGDNHNVSLSINYSKFVLHGHNLDDALASPQTLSSIYYIIYFFVSIHSMHLMKWTMSNNNICIFIQCKGHRSVLYVMMSYHAINEIAT